MSRKCKVSWNFSVLLSLSLQSMLPAAARNLAQDLQDRRSASNPPQQGIEVTVLVHNYAQLPAQILGEAKGRASLIFRKAGVEINFAECPLNDADASLYLRCPEFSDATQLFLRIFPATKTKTDLGGEAFVAARIANIYWNRVEERARDLNVSTSRILAHTIAHELGHLLLGSDSHAPTGIMTAHWKRQVLIQISQEGLCFNNQQSEFIRTR